MPFDAHARIVVALRETQDLFSYPSSFLEFSPVDKKAGESPQDREQLWYLPLPLKEFQSTRVSCLDLLRIAFDSQQRPSQACLYHNLLKETLRCVLGRRKHVQQI